MAATLPKPLVNEELAASFALTVMELFPEAGPDFAAAATRTAFFWGERCLTLFEEQQPLPQPPACQAGCDFCCYNQVELTAPEALFLGDSLAARLTGSELQAMLTGAAASVARRQGLTKQQVAAIRRQLPCPLLVERHCLLYEARPLMCRAMHSLAVRDCQEELIRPQQARVRFYRHRQVIYLSLSQGLIDACRALGLQGGPLDLAQALQDYFGRGQVQQAWLRREMVFTRPPSLRGPQR